MAKYKDKIDLYSDRGKLIESDVPIEAVSPLLNPTIRKIINTTKRTVAINLGGIEKSLASGKLGGKEKKYEAER